MKKIILICALAAFLTGCKAAGPAGIQAEENFTNASLAATDFLYSIPFDAKTFEDIFAQAQGAPLTEKIAGAVVPHHLLAGNMAANFFKAVARQKPSTVIIIGPNHYLSGNADIITSFKDWQTPFGMVETAKDLLSDSIVAKDDETMAKEYSVAALVPYIAKYLPGAKIAPLIIKYQTASGTLQTLADELEKTLPADAVVVASVDFSHYMTWPVANFHDELARAVVKNFDYDRLRKLDVDSPGSLFVLLKLMENRGAQKIAFETADNSARILGQPSLKETTGYYSSWFVKGDKALEEPAASFLFFGDTMLERNVEKTFKANGGPDYLFKELAGGEGRFFMGTDIIHANLEGPFADKRRSTTKEIAFRFDPALIPTLKKYNFNLFTVANNHALDMGSAGLKESAKNLTAAGIDFYGDGYGLTDAAVKIKKIGGVKVGFIGLNDTFYRLNDKTIVAMIKKIKTQSDFVVVSIHWGDEYKELSNARQKILAHSMVDAGADAIIGHHPHVAEEMEVYKNRPIFYSLGNFIFDQYFSAETQRGLAVGLVLYPKQISVYVFPLQGAKSQVQQMDFEAGQKYLTGWVAQSRLNGHVFDEFGYLKIEL